MAKTRSQTGNITIKKEEEDCKRILGLNSVTMTTRNKITKRKSSKRNNRRIPVQQVKVEEDTDTKALLKSTSKSPKLSKRIYITQEQINQLIDAIVNDKMSVCNAARTVKISIPTARYYYNQYKNNPDKKMPLPQSQLMYPKTYPTPEQVENLIRYIVDDKMSISKASAKANLAYESGRYYYNKYLNDPDHAIPVLPSRHHYTQDQKNELIGYIVNDKMTIRAASKKAKMSNDSGRRYFHEYFKEHPDLATPDHIVIPKYYTQKQIKELISCIVDDEMTIAAASRKTNINPGTAREYYQQYLKDNNMEIPVSKCRKRYTQDIINELIRYTVNEKMSIYAASKKANMDYNAGRKYYHRYLVDHNLDVSIRKPTTQDQINEFIGYIVNDKMTISTASKKVKFSATTGYFYYHRYLKQHNLEMPTRK